MESYGELNRRHMTRAQFTLGVSKEDILKVLPEYNNRQKKAGMIQYICTFKITITSCESPRCSLYYIFMYL